MSTIRRFGQVAAYVSSAFAMTITWHGIRMPLPCSVATVALFLLLIIDARRRRLVESDAQGLWVDGHLVAPVDRIVSAHVRHGSVAMIRMRGWTSADVHARNNDDAHAIVASLRLPPASVSLSRIAVTGTRHRNNIAILAAAVVSVALFAAIAILGLHVLLPIAPVPIFFASAFTGERYVLLWLGADGLRLQPGLLRITSDERYVPYSQVRSIEDIGEDRLHITLTTGEQIDLGFRHERARNDAGNALRAAKARAAPDDASAYEARELSRGDRTSMEWLRAIQDLARPNGRGYREPAITDAALRRVIAQPDAPASTRIAAALALREVSGDEARDALVEQARVTGNNVVQDGLLRIADGLDEQEAATLLERADAAG